MTMFKVKWPSGLEETEEVSDCDTLAQYTMRRWGANAVDELDDYGVSIELVTDGVEHDGEATGETEDERNAREAVEFADFQRRLAEKEDAERAAAAVAMPDVPQTGTADTQPD